MAKTKWIYMISDACGVAKVSPEQMVPVMEQSGYRRCSYRTWLNKKREFGKDPLVIKMSGKITLSVEEIKS